MKDGFVKVAASSIAVTVADPHKNAEKIIEVIRQADTAGVNLLVLPELCITGYTCGDLFYNESLLDGALHALRLVCTATEDLYPVVVVGLPLRFQHKLYDCAAVLAGGNILGIVPKIYLSKSASQFSSGAELAEPVAFIMDGEEIPFGVDLLFRHESMDHFCFGVEIGDDLWAADPPSRAATAAGALLIANPGASYETVGADVYRRMLVSSTSARLNCGYIFGNAGPQESTQDLVFSRHHLIAENGAILAESKPFATPDFTVTELDLQCLASERAKNKYFKNSNEYFMELIFAQELHETRLTRVYDRNPFLSSDKDELDRRAEAILQTQAYGLKKRLEHTWAKRAVIGISGGLDSTLALLVAVRAMKLLDRPSTDVLAVTMPCFGTSSRTKNNAITLCKELGVELREVNIAASVSQHFKDIGQDAECYDVTFENAQARERTQVLMDIANQCGGLVIGTGDLSELALGWATYNGDHMSMYSVNASVPKTLVRYIVGYEAKRTSEELHATLLDILDTPVSPELLPVDQEGNLSQKTEDLVGPYELHDFYLYHFVRFGYPPKKLLRLAKYALGDLYSDEVLTHWLRTFLRRFFNQQFKRSCLPDGPKVGSVSLSPRGDWQMPSDATAEIWLKDLDQ